MKYRLDNLQDELKKFSLKKEEKAAIRHALLSHIAAHPEGAKQKAAVPSPFYKRIVPASVGFYSFFRSSSYVSAFAIIVLILGGSISLAAENALPGDTLYTVKGFNENVQGLLAVSTVSRANFQAGLAVKRVEEAEKLAVQGRLTPAVRAQINTDFIASTASFKVQVKKLEDDQNYTSAVATVSNLQSSLKAHENVLLAVETTEATGTSPEASTTDTTGVIDDGSTASSTSSVVSQVQAAISDVQTSSTTIAKVQSEDVADVSGQATNALADAQTTIDSAARYINGLSLNPASLADARAKLDDAKQSFDAGKGDLDSQLSGDAFLKFKDAQTKANQLQVSLQTLVNLNISPNTILSNGTTTATSTSATSTPSSGKGTASSTPSAAASTTPAKTLLKVKGL